MLQRTITRTLLVLQFDVPHCRRRFRLFRPHPRSRDRFVWDTTYKPLLLKRFPRSTPDQFREAHAYAYGGSIIQDMGYYPFGSKFFSDLVHYARSGDF